MNENVVLVWSQWADYLEELVQCPVCYEPPVGPVPMCVQGHHMCRSCRKRITTCPTCRSDFNESRNFVVEKLCLKLLSNVPVMGCRIGSCQKTLQVDPRAKRMYRHVRHCHRESLIKVKTKRHLYGSSCSKILLLEYNFKRAYDFALYAEELGLFFVNLYIDGEGNLLVAVQMANSRQNSKLYYEVSLYVPRKRLREECEGTVQECSNTTVKYSQAMEYDKGFFSCYFEPDFVTRNDCKKPFTLTLYIYDY